MKLTTITNQHPNFYPTLGPYLANRDVVKAVGGPIWDDPNKTWIIATNKNQVIGFIGLTPRGSHVVVESLYTTTPAAAAKLVTAATKQANGQDLVTTVAATNAEAFLAADFTETSRTANFVKLHRSPK